MIKYTIYGSFDADEELSVDELQELHQAVSAQLEEQHNVRISLVRTEVETSELVLDACCGACGLLYEDGTVHVCDLDRVPAGSVINDLLTSALVPILHELAQLINTAFYLTVDAHPRWIEIDEQRIHTDVGVMLTEHLRRHYSYNTEATDA